MSNQNKFRLFIIKTMMLIISLTIFSYTSLFAQQPGWFPLISGTSETCNGVFFVDANTGYVNITGSTGFILKTTNAGSNWIQQTVPTTNWMRSVFFTDINTGYIASGSPSSGNVGNICKTTNGGANWIRLPLLDSAHFYSLYFLNSNTGYASGYKIILKTTDAGNSWLSQIFPQELEWFSSIYFADANTGFATEYSPYQGSGHIIRTTNGGINWGLVLNNNDGHFFGINFINANTGVAAGGPYLTSGAYIFRTTNGGSNWIETFSDNNINFLWSVRFINQNIGYAAGGNDPDLGVILKTTNAGLNWYYQVTNDNNGLLGNYFINENTGYVGGWNGKILKTTDGGGNFVGINPVTNEIPSQFQLYQNYPNPFNPTTNIRIDIPENSFVKLTIYDIMGREVATLVNAQLASGTYKIDWDASNYTSGTYFYRLTVHQGGSSTGDFSETKKMILIK